MWKVKDIWSINIWRTKIIRKILRYRSANSNHEVLITYSAQIIISLIEICKKMNPACIQQLISNWLSWSQIKPLGTVFLFFFRYCNLNMWKTSHIASHEWVSLALYILLKLSNSKFIPPSNNFHDWVPMYVYPQASPNRDVTIFVFRIS